MNKTGTRSPVTPEGVTEHPLCGCHGEKMLWQKDATHAPGGYWRCAEKRREYNKRRSAQRTAWVKEKEEADPLYKIANELLNRRRKALKRMAARHLPRKDDLDG